MAGDNFDFLMQGRALRSQDNVFGFGNWGQLWFNVDATNLYVGGMDLDMGGTNNVFMLFLGLDTLTDNAWNLWHKSGPPNAVDFLHNLRFTEPMDLAIILGIGRNNVRDLMRSVDFPTVTIGNRKVVSVIAFTLWSLKHGAILA